MMKPALALTMGDPVGVGPEIIVRALSNQGLLKRCRIILIGDLGLLFEAATRFAPPRVKRALERAPAFTGIPSKRETEAHGFSMISLSNFKLAEIRPGRPEPEHGRAAASYIEAAHRLVKKKAADAMVTAPINKRAMLAGGSRFGGHTEMLAALSGAKRVVMMLANSGMRVALVTTHIPLADVPGCLSREKILHTILDVNEGLKKNFGIKRPRLVVAGLNPHAGEGGVLGREDEDIIAPAVALALDKKILVQGPLPPDTLFIPQALKISDAVICMYHDQGLIPVKMPGLEGTVNITLGLPFVRTSPGHGTAPDIAWKGEASEGSLLAAIETALRMVRAGKRRGFRNGR